MAEDDVRIEHPNRSKASSKASKAVVILLLLVSAALVLIVTIGGWDALQGAKATAQWREHLAFEERERKLHYDRDRMKDHRAVLKLLIGTRARYDRARSAAAVTAIKARVPETAEAVRRRVERIDHWRVNSNLLADYDAMLNALAEAYPAARIKFIEGDRAPLLAVRAELDRRQKAIDQWLKEAAESEDE